MVLAEKVPDGNIKGEINGIGPRIGTHTRTVPSKDGKWKCCNCGADAYPHVLEQGFNCMSFL